MFVFIFFLFAPLLLFAYLTWRWPARAIYLAIFLIPTYLLRTTLLNIPTNFFELSVLTILAVFILRPTLRRAFSRSLNTLPRSIIIFTSLFLVTAFLSTFISAVPRVSLGILKGWIIIPILLACLIQTLYFLSHRPNYQLLITNSLIYSGAAVACISFFFYQSGQRLSGIYDAPNSLALYLAPIIVLAIIKATNSTTKTLSLVSAVVMFIALLLTQSMAGIISVLIVGAAAVLFRVMSLTNDKTAKQSSLHVISNNQVGQTRFYWLYILLSLWIVSFIFLLTVGRLNYFMNGLYNPSVSTSLSVRLQLWDVSLELIKQQPILGIGLGQFEPHYQQVLHDSFKQFEICTSQNLLVTEQCKVNIIKQPIAEWVFRDPHNWPLSFWLNMGLLGLISFSAINIWVFTVALSHKQQLGISNQLLPISFALLTMLTFGLVDTIYWKNDLAALYWVLISILIIEFRFDQATSFRNDT